MIWLWILLSVLGLLVGLPLLFGLLLGDEYEGRVRVELPCLPDRVWAALVNFEKHPVSGSMAREVTALEPVDSGPAWVEDLGSTRLHVVTEVCEAPRRLVLAVADQVAPMTARWELELRPTHDGGTELLATNQTVIRSGTWHSPIFRLIMRTTGGAEKVLREYLRGVAGDLGVTARVLDPSPEATVADGRSLG